MPELPEVELIRYRITPYMEGKEILRVEVRNFELRRHLPAELQTELPGQTIERIERRGKYLLVRCSGGTVILHLGMTGDLNIIPASAAPRKHDHLDIVFTDGLCLRFHDPRRFGSVIWTKEDPLRHFLLSKLGPEPFSSSFTGRYLFKLSRSRRISVKQFIMDGKVVAGLGNIYANEALFRSGISPQREARDVSHSHYCRLRDAVLEVLHSAIKEGLSDLVVPIREGGNTGYFPVNYYIYGKAGSLCRLCGTTIVKIRQAGRSTFYCPVCQA
jgi:formamidopyrimidine-DNA glycosylase